MSFAEVNSVCYLATFFCFALLETLLCSGITYGWASIVYVFKTEFFYMHLCENWYADQNKTMPSKVMRKRILSPPAFEAYTRTVQHTNNNNFSFVRGGTGFIDDGKLPGCPAQDARLNLVFTVSLFCLCGIKFPAGVFIDRCGPRMARTVGG